MNDRVLQNRIMLLEQKLDDLFEQLGNIDKKVRDNIVLIGILTDLSSRVYSELEQTKKDNQLK